MIRGEPLDLVLAVAMQVAGDDAVEVIDNRAVRVATGDSRAPALTRALVEAGVAVHEIRQTERSLEEVFFEMTGSSASHDSDSLQELVEVTR